MTKAFVTQAWLKAKLAELESAGVSSAEVELEGPISGETYPVMRCKLMCHSVYDNPHITNCGEGEVAKDVRFGAVWEGSTEAQQASINSIFGKMTPFAEFRALIRNPNAAKNLVPGDSYYVDFTPAN